MLLNDISHVLRYKFFGIVYPDAVGRRTVDDVQKCQVEGCESVQSISSMQHVE